MLALARRQLLQGGGAEPFDRRDRMSRDAIDARLARAHRPAVQHHRARAALAEAAAEFHAVQVEAVAENVEQRLRGVPRIGGDAASVQAKPVAGHGADPILSG